LKNILNEVKRIQKLMGLNESSEILNAFKNTQEKNNCNYYDVLNPPEGVDYFFQVKLKSMTNEEKEKIFSNIKTYVNIKFKEAKEYYKDTYLNGEGYNKLYNNFAIGNKEKNIQNLIDYIINSKIIIYFNLDNVPSQFKPVSNAWAFTQFDNVYINLFNFWDGTVAGKKSLYDTVIHELNHVLQNYMLNNPNEFLSPFYNVSKENTTVVKSKEIHSYLQTIRSMFGISVIDSESSFLQKIKNKVENNNLKWSNGEIKYINDNLVFFKKNKGIIVDFDISTSEEFRKNMLYYLHYNDSSEENDERIADTTFLFSNYVTFGKLHSIFPDSKYPNVKVAVVNLEDIAKINLDFAMNGIETDNQKI
jgi:hypothetical protein